MFSGTSERMRWSLTIRFDPIMEKSDGLKPLTHWELVEAFLKLGAIDDDLQAFVQQKQTGSLKESQLRLETTRRL